MLVRQAAVAERDSDHLGRSPEPLDNATGRRPAAGFRQQPIPTSIAAPIGCLKVDNSDDYRT
jgi:hypothetical protein